MGEPEPEEQPRAASFALDLRGVVRGFARLTINLVAGGVPASSTANQGADQPPARQEQNPLPGPQGR